MPIRFRCPHCKKPLSVKDHLAGKKATCPACKKPIAIPSAAASVGPAPVSAEPPPNIEELAAAALSEEPQGNGKAEAPAGTIDFTCDFCDTELHVPREDAGKRVPCPNPECRRIIKVPSPKEEKAKDWREIAKKGPAAALVNQPEKIDEAAWGTETDRGRVTTESLREAGAIAAPPAPELSQRTKVHRVLLVIVAVPVLLLAAYGIFRASTFKAEKKAIIDLEKISVKEPVLQAEVYRAIAEYSVRHGKKNKDVLDALSKAQAVLPPHSGKGTPVDADLFLIDLALTIPELGGTEEEWIAGEKYQWKDEIRQQLLQTLERITSPEARAMAMRELTTRLLAKKQPKLAAAVAAQISNPVAGRRPPVTSQAVAVLLLEGESVEKLVKAPDPKEVPEPLARVGYAEYYARKGSYADAQELAFAKGPPLEQLEACVGAAQVILSRGKDANPEDAAPFADKALEIVGKVTEQKGKVPSWLLLQTIRVGARVKGGSAVATLPKQLPPDFQPRGYLELILADLDAAKTRVSSDVLSPLQQTDAPNPTALGLGWEALARQNARAGDTKAVEDESTFEMNLPYRPMVQTGIALGR
jgi:hypothetical protein